MSESKIEIIRKIIEKSPKAFVPVHENLLDSFTFPHRRLKQYPDFSFPNNSNVKEFIDLISSNLNEDYHSGIESTGAKYLHCLLNRDTSFFETDEESLKFINYLCVQFMRTKKLKEAICMGVTRSSRC